MPFVHPITVRFYDVDRGGIVFFATYYRFCHDALEEMLTQMFGMPLEAAFAQGLWLSPVVHSEADYHHPLRLGDRLEVILQVARLTQRSITYQFCLRQAVRHLVCAELRLVSVFVDATTQQSLAVPAHIHAGLARLQLLPHSAPSP